MHPSSSIIDSLTIQVTNLPTYQYHFNQFYKENDLILIPVPLEKIPEIKTYRITHESDTRLSLFYSNHSGTRHNPNTYTTFKFVGLKSYDESKDTKRMGILYKFINFLSTLSVEYKLTVIDLSFDFHINRTSIENFLPIRMGTRTDINDPFNYYEKTTLYVEDTNVAKPSLKGCLYDKSAKECLTQSIIRFEISIRDLKKSANNYEAIIEHINKQLLKYKLFYFSVKANCNTAKRAYRNNISVANKENFSSALNKQIFKLHGEEIELSICDDVDNLLREFFIDRSDKITVTKQVPIWLKEIPNKHDQKIISDDLGISFRNISNTFGYTSNLEALQK
ncbi:MAG TPA: hypothetical protein PLM93_07965 [Sulfuricurvum sp.]|nr:MAG: hypothetical protein B7Y30_08710 [Campylobacterales bacterium 16-40-21]OZA03097.1 MAG: hypothetical protein B7X89_05680 [Sulfuricurvum sp. 17-40-25]HQS67103.1 hypothetical protein [Sulfuricurvum sp.]HQT37727.1 hypothetical protein [Sulfuricurvum sp.]